MARHTRNSTLGSAQGSDKGTEGPYLNAVTSLPTIHVSPHKVNRKSNLTRIDQENERIKQRLERIQGQISKAVVRRPNN